MTVLLDTNIIMDALQERSPFDVAAKKILLYGQNGKVKCVFTANAMSDIFYLYSKVRSRKEAKIALGFLLKTYGIVPVTQNECSKALALPNDDFEDALVEVCAKGVGADYIVSRDSEFKAIATEVNVITPDELLAMLK